MPKKITATDHKWVAAAQLSLTDTQARQAEWRGHVDIKDRVRIEVLETYCRECRRPYDDVADEPCAVDVEGNDHLRGGPIGVRKKRGITQPGFLPDIADGSSYPVAPTQARSAG